MLSLTHICKIFHISIRELGFATAKAFPSPYLHPLEYDCLVHSSVMIYFLPTIDFTQNFTHVCHHGKEEEGLFPALGQTGMPTQMGPIPKMIVEHKMTEKLAEQIKTCVQSYFASGDYRRGLARDGATDVQ